MTGRHHERVPGRDQLPIIDMRTGVCGAVLLVRSWNGQEILRLRYDREGQAVAAEAELRSDLRRAPHGDIRSVIAKWRNRATAVETYGELLAWWT